MHYLDTIRDMLCVELEEMARKGKITAGDLATIHTLTDTVKNIDKIKMYNEFDEGYEYSESDGSYARGRDSMGRFTSRNYSRDYERGRSRDGSYARSRDYSRGDSYRRGYSRDDEKETMKEQIEELMESATTEKERQALQRAMNALHNA